MVNDDDDDVGDVVDDDEVDEDVVLCSTQWHCSSWREKGAGGSLC